MKLTPTRSPIGGEERGPDGEDWLSIHQASALLGIAPSTLRRWADEGQIPMKRTLGGHRRFSRQALGRLGGSPPGGPPAGQSPSSHSQRWGIDRQELIRQEWYARLADGPAASQMRGLGQRLLGLLLQYLTRPEDDQRFLSEARLVGSSYGRRARRAQLSMHDTVRACLYFRDAFARLEFPLPGVPRPRDMDELADLNACLNRFMDAILLGLVSGYESHAD